MEENRTIITNDSLNNNEAETTHTKNIFSLYLLLYLFVKITSKDIKTINSFSGTNNLEKAAAMPGEMNKAVTSKNTIMLLFELSKAWKFFNFVIL